MSGALIGRILTLTAEGYFDHLAQGPYQALLAIAEKAGADRDRPPTHAQVRWEWIEGAMRNRKKRTNASRSTADRAIRELKQRGFVAVAARGCKPRGKAVQAPVYEVLLPPLHEVTEPTGGDELPSPPGGEVPSTHEVTEPQGTEWFPPDPTDELPSPHEVTEPQGEDYQKLPSNLAKLPSNRAEASVKCNAVSSETTLHDVSYDVTNDVSTRGDRYVSNARELTTRQTDHPVAPPGYFGPMPWLPSTEEPTLRGITPPSKYCRDCYPHGTNKGCWGCGNRREYRKDTWPLTKDGHAYEVAKEALRPSKHELRMEATFSKKTGPERGDALLDFLRPAESAIPASKPMKAIEAEVVEAELVERPSRQSMREAFEQGQATAQRRTS